MQDKFNCPGRTWSNPFITSVWDSKIIDATSIALGGTIGREDDVQRLREQIEGGSSEDKLKVACEIAVAFIRWSQDLKYQRDTYRNT